MGSEPSTWQVYGPSGNGNGGSNSIEKRIKTIIGIKQSHGRIRLAGSRVSNNGKRVSDMGNGDKLVE